MRSEILRLNKVQKTFAVPGGKASLTALSELDLAVFAGEFLAVVGPSGSGKSTLINLIAGFIAPTSGGIVKNGAPIKGPGPDRVVVFQDHAVFPWYTVLDNIAYGVRAQNLSRREASGRVQEALSLVGLRDCAHMYPAALSGGMRQRVALARALVLRPDILLLDEPFAALDAVARSRLQEELLRLWKRYGWTVIFVTHNLVEAVCLADRVAVLNPPPYGLKSVMPVPVPRPRERRSAGIEALSLRLAREMLHSKPFLSDSQGES